MSKTFIISGAVAGLLAVLLGAFAAHALREHLTPGSLAAFKTGVQYQMTHALALVAVGILVRLIPAQHQGLKVLCWSGGFFMAGIILFSGSLYLLVLLKMSWLGPVTPVGGLALMLGWFMLALGAYRLRPY
jgi:uncharacterized membrane protein YgdD (TMEM256/DUF423 family)